MKSVVQFIKFGIVGISNTLIALAVYYLLLRFGALYLIANTISWVVSVSTVLYRSFRRICVKYQCTGHASAFGC